MPLFIDRLPLLGNTISVSVIVSEPGLDAVPANAKAGESALDTGMSGDTFCWREHLEQAGLDADANRFHRTARVTTAVHLDRPVSLPVRNADIWLVSNIDSLRDSPLRLELAQGIVFRDELPPLYSTSRPRAFIGLRALKRARLRIEIDLAAGVLSVWAPNVTA